MGGGLSTVERDTYSDGSIVGGSIPESHHSGISKRSESDESKTLVPNKKRTLRSNSQNGVNFIKYFAKGGKANQSGRCDGQDRNLNRMFNSSSYDRDLKRVLVTSRNGTSYRMLLDEISGKPPTDKFQVVTRSDGKRFARKTMLFPKTWLHKTFRRMSASSVNSQQPEMTGDSLAEIRVLRHCSHPNITRLYEIQVDDSGQTDMILDYFPSGTLRDFISTNVFRVDDRTVGLVTGQVAQALAYLHSKCIVHRNVRPENCFVKCVNPLIVVLGNFEFSDRCMNASSKIFVGEIGSYEYMAPEVFQGPYGLSCDIWSLGIMTVEMCTGKIANQQFDTDPENPSAAKIHYSLEARPEGCRKLVKRMLQVDILSRYSATEIVRDDWVVSHCQRNPLRESTIAECRKIFAAGFEAFSKMSETQRLMLRLCAFDGYYSDAHEVSMMFQALDVNNNGIISKERLAEHFPIAEWQKQSDIPMENSFEWVDILTMYIASSPFRTDQACKSFAPILVRRLPRRIDGSITVPQAVDLMRYIHENHLTTK